MTIHQARRIFLFSLLSVCSVAFFFAFEAAAQARLTVELAAERTLDGELVRLGDVAEISGAGAEKARAVSLGYAPNVGATRVVERRQIALALAAAGFAADTIEWQGAPRTMLRRAGQEVSSDAVRAAVEKALLAKLKADGIEARLARFDAPQSVAVPAGAVEIVPHLGGVRNFFQPFSVAVEIRLDGRPARRFATTAALEAEAEILTAARALAAGEKLTAADVRLAKRRLTRPLAAYVRDAAALRGRALLKTLAAGDEITLDALYASVVVKAGDAVRIEGRTGRLAIIVAGVARSSGKIGDRIAVKNTQSGAILQATIVDEGIVRINF